MSPYRALSCHVEQRDSLPGCGRHLSLHLRRVLLATLAKRKRFLGRLEMTSSEMRTPPVYAGYGSADAISKMLLQEMVVQAVDHGMLTVDRPG